MAILRKNQMDYMRTKLDRQEKVEEMEALLRRTQGVNGEQVYNPLFSSSAPRYGNRDNLFGKSSSKGLLGSLFEGLNAKAYGSQNKENANGIDFSLSLSDFATQRENKRNKDEYRLALYKQTLPQKNNIANVYDVVTNNNNLSRRLSYGDGLNIKGKHDFSKDMIPEIPDTKAQKTIRIFPLFEGEPKSGNAQKLLAEWRTTLKQHGFMYETVPSYFSMFSDFFSGKGALLAVRSGKIVVNGAADLLKLHKLIEPLTLLHSNNYGMCSRDTECNPILQDLHEVLGTLVKIK